MKHVYWLNICFSMCMLLVFPLQVKSTYYSDTQKITLKMHNVSVGEIFREIEKQSGYTFFYSLTTLDARKKVSFQCKSESIQSAIDKFIGSLGLSFIIKGKSIIIRRKDSIVINLSNRSDIDSSNPGKISIAGYVYSSEGAPMPGVSIKVQETALSTQSNLFGYYELRDISGKSLVQFSSVGYKTLVRRASAIGPRVFMDASVTELKNVEIVSTGYQDLSKDNITGSVATIDNKQYNRQVGNNVLDRIYNITSGLINDPNGSNGGRLNLVVRGISTFSGATNPLIVVDNFPFDGNIESINPNDVESVTVLKDAAAAAIWGSRAGNGVVVITTKKGKFNSRPKLSLNVNYSFSEKSDLWYMPILSSSEMIEFEKKQYASGLYEFYDDLYPSFNYFPVIPMSIEVLLEAKRKGISDPLSNAETLSQLVAMGQRDIRSDILRHMMQNGQQQQYALNIAGGSENHAYYASVGYDRMRAEEVKNNNNRITLNYGNTFKLFNKVELSGQIVHSRISSLRKGILYSQLLNPSLVSPYATLLNENGDHLAIPYLLRSAYVDTAKYPALMDWHFKPLDEYNNQDSRVNSNETRITAGVRYSILPWLKLEGQYQGEIAHSEVVNSQGINSFEVRNGINSTMMEGSNGSVIYPWPRGSVLETTNGTMKSWSIRGSIHVNKSWSNSRLVGILGSELRENNTEYRYDKIYGFDPETYTRQYVNPLASLPARPLGAVNIGQVPNPVGSLYRFGSTFSNFEYNILDRYSLSASARIDQSNSFGLKSNLRKVPLWSLGASWILNEEKWYNISLIPLMKIKGSFGFTGNTIFGSTSYATFEYLNNSIGIPPIDGLIFGRIKTPNNPGLKWEKVKIINIGLELGLVKNRVNALIEVYSKQGLDLVGDVKADPTSGFYSFIGNNAKIKGRGIDVTIRSNNINIGLFQWNSTLLLSFNKDKVVDYYFPGTLSTADLVRGAGYEIGRPLNSVYSFKWAGLDPQNGDPRIMLGDTIANYSEIDKARLVDLKFNGSSSPRCFGSLMNDFSWKGISLSANILFRFKYFFRRGSVNYSDLLQRGWNGHEDFSKRWKSKGDESLTNVPSLPDAVDGKRDLAYELSEHLVERGDHVRLQDVRLSYSLGEKKAFGLNFRSMNIYFYASNLGILWKANKAGLDPNASSFGSMPIPRSYSLGININY